MFISSLIGRLVHIGLSNKNEKVACRHNVQNGILKILNDLDSAGRGRKRDEEEGGTKKKKGRVGRKN